MIGVIKAKELHGRHPGLPFPVDVEKVAILEGCSCVTWPFLEPVREVKRGNWIGVADWLDEPERRRCVAHALGHHLLLTGNQLTFQGWRKPTRSKQEREAEEFAAHFLIPAGELCRVIDSDFKEIAGYFGVPEDLLRRRLTEFAPQDETDRWQERRLEP